MNPHPTSDTPQNDPWFGASWIWGKSIRPDQYRCFRRRFELAQEPHRDAIIRISVDSDFVAFLNGEEIGRHQFSDLQGRKTWSEFPIAPFLNHGLNTLAVLVFYRGEDFSDYEVSGAGLIASLQSGDFVLTSDQTWLTSLHPAFRQGKAERMTLQSSFTFHYDARHEDDWYAPDFDDASWKPARIVQQNATGDIFRSLTARPLPPLSPGAMSRVTVCRQGTLFIEKTTGTTAQRMSLAARRHEYPWDIFANSALLPNFGGADSFAKLSLQESGDYTGSPTNAGVFLSPDTSEPLVLRPRRGVDGRYFIVDLGEEMTGLLEWDLEASAGTVLHIAHGEHLADGCVRARIGGRNFADSYVCKTGRQRFHMPFRRIGGRFLEIHVLGKAEITFYSLGLRRVEYPAQRLGSFSCHDGLVNHIHEIALRTLELCRHDHYEDCPWREQALYAYDARLQALYGYYAFGDYHFPEVSFSLLGNTVDQRGLVALTAPGKCPITIPVFTFTWVVALGEHWMFSGRDTLFQNFRETVELVFSKLEEQYNSTNGLYRLPTGEGIWHFYEWTPGLSGMGKDAPQSGDFHAAYNLHAHEALRWYAWMLEQSGDTKKSAQIARRCRHLKRAIHNIFWDSQASFYRASVTADGTSPDDTCYELVQALTLHEGVVPRTVTKRLLCTLLNNKARPSTLSGLYYLVQPLAEHSEESALWLDHRLNQPWRDMALRGATTMWETVQGDVDFDLAGSLCHGWSALPVYYHQACLLGIKPTQPGFRSFQATPAAHLAHSCRGRIPTPSGPIEITWSIQNNQRQSQIRSPKGCRQE